MTNELVLFDYAELDAETRIVVQQRTDEIKTLVRRSAQDIVDIGQKLIEIKARLGHGQFGAWLTTEFEWTQQTASNFMNVALRFGQNSKILEFAPSALYMLASPSTPEPARLEALERAGAGERITYSTAREIVQEHRPYRPARDGSDRWLPTGDGFTNAATGEPLHHGRLERTTFDTPQPILGKRDYVTIDQWQTMTPDERRRAIRERASYVVSKMNAQDTDNIEWARWSWNPVTGCLHNCSYCYARDIAARFYEHGFKPAFFPDRLQAPANTKVPSEAATNIGYKNVFTCSMADLFGRWVPREWIEAVLQVVADNQQWNFLFLTKFPIRLAEFEFPANAWLGTTVDAQARVANAEKAFSRVRGGVKWLSCEPLLEPLTFTSLDMFDWVVIGGASKSTQTPEFRPPRPWIEHLEAQARRAGCRVYEKTNLLERLKEYPGQDDASPVNVPDAFKMAYLQRDVLTPANYAGEFGL